MDLTKLYYKPIQGKVTNSTTGEVVKSVDETAKPIQNINDWYKPKTNQNLSDNMLANYGYDAGRFSELVRESEGSYQHRNEVTARSTSVARLPDMSNMMWPNEPTQSSASNADQYNYAGYGFVSGGYLAN